MNNKVTSIISLKGKARQVFSYLELLAKHKGNVTLGELAGVK
jgi:hypothetical protein